MQVTRYDRGNVGSVRIDEATGFLKVPATVTRVGVFTYRYADGSEVREFRPPEEVFHPSALDGLRQAVVTMDHPVSGGEPVSVNSTNVREFQIGHTGDSVEVKGDHVGVPLTITHQDAIDAIQTGGPREVSCGYTAVVENRSGVWEGPRGPERFDAVQTNIRYNHVAVVDKGRAGPSVRLHMDSAEQIEDQPRHEPDNQEDETMKLEDLPAELAARFDDLKAQIKASDDLQSKCDAIEAERDQLKSELEQIKADKLDEDQIAELVAERSALVSKVSEHFDSKDVDLVKLDATGLRSFALKSAGIDVSGKSDAYVEARFDALIETLGKRDRTAGQTVAAASAAAEPKNEDAELEARIDALFEKGAK